MKTRRKRKRKKKIEERERERHFDCSFGTEVGFEDILQTLGGIDGHVKCRRFVQHFGVRVQHSQRHFREKKKQRRNETSAYNFNGSSEEEWGFLGVSVFATRNETAAESSIYVFKQSKNTPCRSCGLFFFFYSGL